jgi:ribosomal protein L18
MVSAYSKGGVDAAKNVACLLSKKYNGKCVFDRNGFLYSGKVKILLMS